MKRSGVLLVVLLPVLLSVLLLISFVSAQYIFAQNVKVTPKFLFAGENIIVSTDIKNLGVGSNKVDIKVSYEIVSENGELVNKSERIINIMSSTMAIQTSLSISEVFKMPEDMKPGDYNIIVKVNYEGDITSASDSFQITKNDFMVRLDRLVSDNQIILITIALMILFISIWRIIHHYLAHHHKPVKKR
jgi:hypothetical protein